VAQAVVDVLEAVHVEEEHGEVRVLAPLPPRQRVREPVDEQRAVGQSGERVVQGVVEQLLFAVFRS